MSIKQFNANYVAEEDRVLFRVTTLAGEEFRLWLTRARVYEILALGEQAALVSVQREDAHLQRHQARTIAQFKQQTVKQSTQFTEFEPAQKLPLGAEPVLVRGMSVVLEGQALVLNLQVASARVLTLRLGQELVSRLRVLLEEIAKRARWDQRVTALSPLSSATPSAGTEQPNDSAEASPPPKKLLH